MPEVLESEKLEYQLEQHRHMIERGEQARRLADHPDFRKVILENFCKEDCARYAMESGDPSLPEENRADALAMAQAAGHLKRYLSYQIQFGETAKRNIDELEEAIAQARAEEAHR